MERITILQEIMSEFRMMIQWYPSHCENCLSHSTRAAALIELLEVEDCGQVGGYDGNNILFHTTGYHLFDRFLTLVRKYKDEKNLKSEADINIKKLTRYFKELSFLNRAWKLL